MLQGSGEEKYEKNAWSLYEQEPKYNKHRHQTATDAEDAIDQGSWGFRITLGDLTDYGRKHKYRWFGMGMLLYTEYTSCE